MSDTESSSAAQQSNKRKRDDDSSDQSNKAKQSKISQPGFKRTGVARNRSDKSINQPPKQPKKQSKPAPKPVKPITNQSDNETTNSSDIQVPKGCFTIFVGGLPYNVTKQSIQQYFNQHGCHVWNVKIAAYQKMQKTTSTASQQVNQSTEQSTEQPDQPADPAIKQPIDQSISSKFANQQRGFAHVEFENEDQVRQAISRWHNQLWSDGEHIISVAVARPKQSSKQSNNQSSNQSDDYSNDS